MQGQQQQQQQQYQPQQQYQLQQQYQPQPYQQQPVTVITQNPPQHGSNDKLSPSSVSQMTVLSIIQIVMGCLCLIFGIVFLALNINRHFGSNWAVLAYGIWIGIYFIIVGGIGIAAARRNTHCLIVASMILNIICCSCWCFSLLGLTSTGLIITSGNSNTCNYYGWGYDCDKAVIRTFYALDCMMLLMSIAELVITIWSAVLCCGAVCRCCKQQTAGHMVQYGNQQVMMYPSYPAAQTTVQSGYPVGVHQQPAATGPYAVSSQVPPNYYTIPAQQSAPLSQQVSTNVQGEAKAPSDA